MQKCIPEELLNATLEDLTTISNVLAPQMKYKRKPDRFIELDLLDSIAISGYILLTKSGEKMYVAEYRRMV